MVEEAKKTKEGKYLYGVIEAKEEKKFGPIGIGGRKDEVYTFPYQDLALVVSDSPVIAYEYLPKEVLIRYLAAHQFVIEQVMKSSTVIPLKFGTMVRDYEDVQEIFKQGYSRFKRALESMNNKIELDVVALWKNLNLILQEIGEEKEIRKFKEEVAKKPPGQIYENKIKLGQMVKFALDKRRSQLATAILDELKEYARDFRLNALMDDSVIMNVAFLMDREKEEKFNQEVKKLNEKYEEKINFRCVGPLPPYSFSTMEVKKVGFERTNRARKVLELDEEATLLEIKEAYRRLTHKYHPDKNPSDLETQERFKEVSNAYKMLTSYCENHKFSFREEDIKNFVAVKVLKFSEE